MDDSLLSVIVPVYNAAKWLPRCLDSICGQTYPQLEIICVNDGSTDDSAKILEEYAAKDSRIKVIHQENAGVSVARNAGLDAAMGEYVTFVDADDWLETDAYEKTLIYMECDVDLVCFGVLIDGDAPKDLVKLLEEYCRVKYQGIQSARDCMFHTNVSIWNKIFRRNQIETMHLCFPKGIAYGEDAAFYYCYAALSKKAYYLPKCLYHYVQHDASAMARGLEPHPKGIDHIQLLNYVYEFYVRNNIWLQLKRIFCRIFEGYYGLALQTTPPALHKKVKEIAYCLAVKSGIIKFKHFEHIRQLLSENQSYIEKVFHWFAENRECYGFCGRALCSVTYEAERTIYRILGKTIKTVKRSGHE